MKNREMTIIDENKATFLTKLYEKFKIKRTFSITWNFLQLVLFRKKKTQTILLEHRMIKISKIKQIDFSFIRLNLSHHNWHTKYKIQTRRSFK